MSEMQQSSGCVKVILVLVAVGAGLFVVQQLYAVGLAAGFDAVLTLDASAYGRLLAPAAWPGYALLGLGLGGAAGAVAAQQRFRLAPGVAWGAAALALALLGAVYFTSTAPETAAVLPGRSSKSLEPDPETGAGQTGATDLVVSADGAAEIVSDTASQPARGWMQVAVTDAPLRASWTDSTAAATDYLQPDDWVRLRRRARGWVLVEGPANRPALGWIRRQALANRRFSAPPAAPPPDDPTAPQVHLDTPGDPGGESPEAVGAAAAGPATAAPAWPAGRRNYVGRVGKFHARFALDWQPDGQLTGTYRMDEQPGLVLRLTGAPAAGAGLELLEFTRGRQTARCLLYPQGEGFAGTMFNTDGRQFAMTLEADNQAVEE